MKKQGLLIHRGNSISWAELETIRLTDIEQTHKRGESNYTSDQRFMEVAPEFSSLPHFCPWRHGKLKRKKGK